MRGLLNDRGEMVIAIAGTDDWKNGAIIEMFSGVGGGNRG
jgi:hypothetical protein